MTSHKSRFIWIRTNNYRSGSWRPKHGTLNWSELQYLETDPYSEYVGIHQTQMKADPQPCLGYRGGGGDLRLFLPLIQALHGLHAHLSPMSSSPKQQEKSEIECSVVDCGTVTIFYGFSFWKVMVPVPTFKKLQLRFRFRFRFQLHI